VERSTYVLFASLALILLFWQWRPIPTVVWQLTDPSIATAIMGVSFVGWLLVLTSTFLINHFELFGLHQVANNLADRPMPAVRFKTPVLYKLVRHPIYLGFIIAFWAAPVMTIGHLLFAAVTTAYIFVGIALEERDLVELFGDEYRRYKERVGMLVPFWRKAS
jgi:protein-S-isoprenylcysteine O-methyltransferase Ste14